VGFAFLGVVFCFGFDPFFYSFFVFLPCVFFINYLFNVMGIYPLLENELRRSDRLIKGN
jgi:hypothetical protein